MATFPPENQTSVGSIYGWCWYRIINLLISVGMRDRMSRTPARVLSLLSLLTIIGPSLQGQDYHSKRIDLLTEKWRWVRFSELEGKGVRCIAEDQVGQVWFGIDEGIMMYNGRAWSTHGVGQGLPPSPIQQLVATGSGKIYAASNSGIYVYDEVHWEPVLMLDGSTTFDVFQMYELSDESVMLGTNFGVIQIQDDFVTRVFTTRELYDETSELFGVGERILLPEESVTGQDFHVSDIIEDRRENIWFAMSLGTFGTILRFNQREVRDGAIAGYEVFRSSKEILFGEDQKMIETLEGDIWVVNRSFKIGINVFDGQSWQTFRLNDQFGTDEYCTGILQTSDGTIWIASLGKLYTYTDKWNIHRSSDSRIPTNKLLLARSHDERLWICGFKAQAYLFDFSDERWVTYNDLNYQCEAGDGSLWFLNVAGNAVVKDGEHWRAYGMEAGMIDAPVRLVSTSDGLIWAAGSHQGVAATAYLEKDRWHRQLHPKLSWGIDYRAVLEAFDGSLWFGAAVDFDQDRGQSGGVLQMTRDNDGEMQWIHHRYRQNGLLQSNAYGIGQSLDSLIWIGGGSLYYYDGETWSKSDHPLLRDFVNIVHSTPDGLMLAGSRYYGIFTYDGTDWKVYNAESGLMSNTIMSLYGSSPDFVWAATEDDISRFDGENWVNMVLPESMNINFEGGSILSSSDGAVWINHSLREWKRRAFVGDKKPVDLGKSFVTYCYRPDNHPPETHFDVYNEKVSPKGNTLVTWTGADYMGTTTADRLQYAYRLNGAEWSPFSSSRHHTFLNLSNGKYTLEVRARDLDLNIDPTPATIHFQVQPPVWKQAWFILLLLAFLIITGLFEYRVIRKNKTLHRLNRSLSNINVELQDKNSEIARKNAENLEQQEQILAQKRQLEESFKNLSSQNKEIEFQRDKLAEMVVQIEDLNRSKIKFFTNVSHELRTPLTLILGPAHQLQEQMLTLPDDKRKRLYKIIERNAYKLLKLINQLLEMRRIESNQLELNLSTADLGAFIGDITQLFDNLASERQIAFSFINTCPMSQCSFDKDKVEKIATNLISNAFKHTPIGGEITIRLTHNAQNNRENGNAEDGSWFRISVEDTGTGISETRMPHIFERYYSDNSDRLSSGIGLSYIKDLVEVHNGKIHVQSEKGKGTTFCVDLPALLVDDQDAGMHVEMSGYLLSASEVSHLFTLIEPEPKDISAGPSQPGRKTILVVENDADLLDFLGVMLEDKYNIIRATNGLSGLDVARHENVDLILSDVMMPQMDGLEMCHHLKSDLVTSHIPIILLTAKAMDTHRMQGYMQGADAYMTKPFNPRVLLSRIENLLSQRAQLREAFNRDFVLKPKHITLDSVDDNLLTTIVQIMEDHIDESDFNVNKMCHMVGMSHTHFIRKVKQLTGKKPVDLLKTFRLSRAKDLLQQNNANIAEIAYMVGYNLPNSFSRAFKKEFDISPKEYAEQFAHKPTEERGMRAKDQTQNPESH